MRFLATHCWTYMRRHRWGEWEWLRTVYAIHDAVGYVVEWRPCLECSATQEREQF